MSYLEMRFLIEYVIWVQALHTSQLPPYRVDSYLSRLLNHLFLRCNLTAKDRTLGFSVSKLLEFEAGIHWARHCDLQVAGWRC